MHPYSINNSDKKIAYTISLVLCVVLGWIFSKGIEGIPNLNKYLWIVDVPSAFVLFGLVFKLFDVFFWKYFSKYCMFFKTPNMNGIYEGEIISSNDNNHHTVKITIRQTLTDIRIYLKTDLTSSKREIASILIDEEENPIILYEYINININTIKSALPMHRGLTRLNFNKNEKTLIGDYFTSPERKNYGKINVKKIQM